MVIHGQKQHEDNLTTLYMDGITNWCTELR